MISISKDDINLNGKTQIRFSLSGANPYDILLKQVATVFIASGKARMYVYWIQ